MSKQTEIDGLLVNARRYFFDALAGRAKHPENPGSFLWRASRCVAEAEALGATVTAADVLPEQYRIDVSHWPVWCAVAEAVCAEKLPKDLG